MYHRLTNWRDMCAMYYLFNIWQFMSWYKQICISTITPFNWNVQKKENSHWQSATNQRKNTLKIEFIFFHIESTAKLFVLQSTLFSAIWHFWFAKVIELIRQNEPMAQHSENFHLLSREIALSYEWKRARRKEQKITIVIEEPNAKVSLNWNRALYLTWFNIYRWSNQLTLIR